MNKLEAKNISLFLFVLLRVSVAKLQVLGDMLRNPNTSKSSSIITRATDTHVMLGCPGFVGVANGTGDISSGLKDFGGLLGVPNDQFNFKTNLADIWLVYRISDYWLRFRGLNDRVLMVGINSQLHFPWF